MIYVGMVLALLAGLYIGLGFPGLPGRENRVLPSGMRRRKKPYFTPLDLLRRQERPSGQKRAGRRR
jgi:hypothetical protein